MAIKAIIFDIDGVLADSRRAVVHNTKALLGEYGFEASDKKVRKMSSAHSAETVLVSLAPDLKNNRQLLRKMLSRLSELTMQNTHLVRPLPLVEKVPLLAKKYSLAAATNRKSSARLVLRKLGILRHFSAVVTSADAPPKPDPAMILLALKKLHVKPSEAVFVGDNDEDRMAGETAGVHVIMLCNKDIFSGEKYLGEFLGENVRKQTRN